MFLCCHSLFAVFSLLSVLLFEFELSPILPSSLRPSLHAGFMGLWYMVISLQTFICSVFVFFLLCSWFSASSPAGCLYTYEWNALRVEWFKDLKGGKSNEKSGFKFKHLWWALITSPLRKKSKLWRTWGNRKPQASHLFVSSEPPGLSGFHSYLGHGALSSQKSTTGGFLGGKLGWSSQAL